QKGPDLAVGRRREATILQIADEARLEHRHHRAEPHRYRGELPEVRHQPGVWIRGEPLAGAAGFLAEVAQLLFREPSFQIRTRIDSRRGMSLHEDQVTGVLVRGGPPEVVEAHLV